MSLHRYTLPVLCSVLLDLACGCSGGAANDAVETTGASAAALRNCPPTDPNYPTCVPEPDGCAAATATLTATPPDIFPGQTSKLTWALHAPAACSAEITLDSQAVGWTGTKVVAPLSSTPSRLRLGTKQIAEVNVVVHLPSTVHINGSTPDWKRLLVQALGNVNTRVVLAPSVDMDMAGYQDIVVAQGVTLTSEAPAIPRAALAIGVPPVLVPPPARDAQNPGPRLYTNERPRPLFRIECGDNVSGDNARLIGFRLQGPHYETEEGSDNLERGIQVVSCLGVEIADMEISGFSGRSMNHWAVSLGGRSAWQPWTALNDDTHRVLIGSVDGIPGDDVLRYVMVSPTTGRWDISSGARTGWQTFATSTSLSAAQTIAFVGRFDGFPGADLLAIGGDRMSRIFSLGHANFTPHGLYAY